MFRLRFTGILIGGGLLLTALLIWSAAANYRNAEPVAQSILRGLSFSLGQAIESMVARDPSLKSLSSFRTHDIAYFCLIDRQGMIRFHSNPDLIGERIQDTRYAAVAEQPIVTEERTRLGTGELVFETHQQLHVAEGTLILRLALHTWQADQIIRRARTGAAMILALVACAWGLGLWALRLQRLEMRREKTLARREHLAGLGELGAVLAHEVRTPLAGIKGYAQLLLEKAADDRTRRFSGTIVGEVVRLEELVNDLLLYARQESGAEGRVVAGEAVQSAWELLAEQARQQGVVLRTEGDISVQLSCSPDQLRQVLLNLCANALSVQPAGGEVRIAVLPDSQKMIRIAVADRGPGFTEEALQRCFDPFYTTRPSGSGLGLAVCRKIVEGCGGTIMAQNRVEGGAELVFRLPAAPDKDIL